MNIAIKEIPYDNSRFSQFISSSKNDPEKTPKVLLTLNLFLKYEQTNKYLKKNEGCEGKYVER